MPPFPSNLHLRSLTRYPAASSMTRFPLKLALHHALINLSPSRTRTLALVRTRRALCSLLALAYPNPCLLPPLNSITHHCVHVLTRGDVPRHTKDVNTRTIQTPFFHSRGTVVGTQIPDTRVPSATYNVSEVTLPSQHCRRFHLKNSAEKVLSLNIIVQPTRQLHKFKTGAL